ncbi:hypothetical protein [Leifsonia sp. Leaf264]|uniref:hypothetical protein n=1 Tax=Leifsonia sp. Leaf264 TaxID=1736314 RepID=UPI0006FD3E05|nr:hypothetical protein [Leifsonia sp. Leaf264]KQO98192.1 hypothetical protein ASF30_09025 [Leifsonia sp. Leaf264]
MSEDTVRFEAGPAIVAVDSFLEGRITSGVTDLTEVFTPAELMVSFWGFSMNIMDAAPEFMPAHHTGRHPGVRMAAAVMEAGIAVVDTHANPEYRAALRSSFHELGQNVIQNIEMMEGGGSLSDLDVSLPSLHGNHTTATLIGAATFTSGLIRVEALTRKESSGDVLNRHRARLAAQMA